MLTILFPRVTRFAALILLASCGACSNLTPNECLFADWYAKGEEAANAGQPVSSFMVHQRDCGLHGINPDRWDFVLGWEGAQAGKAS